MLLETLDIKKNDIVIYSQNLFDLEKNFKIIYKDDSKKAPLKITYKEVCKFINEFTPKNLIVYRLLTNIKDFGIQLSKYGTFLNINGMPELIYFDPIFAVKELEEHAEAINFYDLRFRIQQVGLTTLNRKESQTNFAEIYSIDLEATEAKFQNDKVFADAIFSLGKIEKNNLPDTEKKKISDENKIAYTKNVKDEKRIDNAEAVKSNIKENLKKDIPAVLSKKILEQSKPEIIRVQDLQFKVKADKQHIDGIRIIDHDISEDADFDYKQIMKINIKASSALNNKKEDSDLKNINQNSSSVIPKLVKTQETPKGSFGKFLKESKDSKKDKKTGETTKEDRTSPLIDIFKSPSSLNNFIKGRENKQVVLKLDKK